MKKLNVLYSVGMYFLLILTNLQAITVGSNLTPSRPARVFFPAADSDNAIQGFVGVTDGFFLEDYTTKCTYNACIKVSGDIGLTGGSFFLLHDLTLSNTLNWLTAGGSIIGAGHSLTLPCTNTECSIPGIGSLGAFSPVQIASATMGANVYTADWNMAGQYLLAGSSNYAAGNEIQLYYFDGSTLTATSMLPAGGEIGRYMNSVYWDKHDNFVVTAFAAGTGNDVNVYYKRSDGGFHLLSGVDLGSEGKVAAWHTSGSFICVGTGAGSIQTYPFNRTTGLLGAVISSVALGSAVSDHAMSFAPGGNFVATGITSGNQLQVLSVTGAGVLATSASISPGAQIYGVDWCPTGTYIAAGLATGTENIRIYAHDVATSSLTEITTCRVAEAKLVYATYWDPTGNLLITGTASGTGPELRVFYFDKEGQRLIEIYRDNRALNAIWGARWHPTGRFFVYTQSVTNDVRLLSVIAPLLINDLSVVLNTDTSLYLPLWIQGNCKINGQGKRLTLQQGAEIVVRPGGSLILENVEIGRLGNSNIRCLTNNGSITWRRSQGDLTNNYTFSQGSLLFDDMMVLTGTNAFIYTSGLTSTLATQSTLYVGPGTTFQYNPILPRQNLLYMTDVTSVLYLDGATLYSTRTGLQLSGGTLMCDDKVTLSSDALYPAEGMSLKSSLAITARGESNINIYGIVRAD